MSQMESQFPGSVTVQTLYDKSLTIEASVTDVKFTLMLTLFLVVLVIFIFLRNISATIIPSLALPMSLVGTFAVMYMLDYSLDNLSLMALTLSVGFVVDDAIVMLENIVRHIEKGEPVFESALVGSREIGFTILSMTMSLVAVFVPVLFLGGLVGRLFHEFAVTIGASIIVSGFVSLTLTPMLCSRFLRPKHEETHNRLFVITERAYEKTLHFYQRTLAWVMDHRPYALAFSGLILLGTIGLGAIVPKGFLAERGHVAAQRHDGDRAGHVVRRDGRAPETARRDRVEGLRTSWGSCRRWVRADAIADDQPGPPLHAPEGSVRSHARCGRRGARAHAKALRGSRHARLHHEPAAHQHRRPLEPRASISSRCRPPTSRRCTTTPASWSRSCTRCRASRTSRATCRSRIPQVAVDIDRDRASSLGITANTIEDALYNAYGARQVSTIYTPNNQYWVVMELEPQYQKNLDALGLLYVHSATGDLVPLGSLAKVSPSTGPATVNHSGQLPSVTLSFNLQPGVSIGTAVNDVQPDRGRRRFRRASPPHSPVPRRPSRRPSRGCSCCSCSRS